MACFFGFESFFPTCLCGVLVFDSVSCSRPRPLRSPLSHTIFHTQLCHTPSHSHNFATHHLSRGRRGTCGTGLALVARLGAHLGARLGALGRPGCRATLHGRRGTMAGVALGDIHLGFAWQAWHLDHLVTSAFVLRGRCGTW